MIPLSIRRREMCRLIVQLGPTATVEAVQAACKLRGFTPGVVTVKLWMQRMKDAALEGGPK